MTKRITCIKQSLAIIALTIAIILSPTAAFANNGSQIIPPSAKIQGKSYGEWSAAWWQWAFSIPADQSPFFDENGSCTNGASGQDGKVWFLAGVFNASGTAERNCTIPSGKFIFFPVLTAECSTVEVPTIGGSEAELRACAQSYRMSNLIAELDGVAISDLDRYRFESPLFTITLPENNILGLPAGSADAIANGIWLMLPPLSAGEHTIRFSGTYPDFDFTLDITYHLTVE